MKINNDDFIGISDERLFHMRGVGRRCQELAKELFDWSDMKCRQMFLMGFLHDVGYEFSVDQLDHAHVAGKMLDCVGYDYWEPIFFHGDTTLESMSSELLILNIADMQISKDGQRISVSERLKDIGVRYGEDSEQYTKACVLISVLRQELEKLSIEPSILE